MPNSKIAIITGAGSGVGRACAQALWEDNYTVVLAGRTETTLQQTARYTDPSRSLVVATDVSDPVSVKNLFSVTRQKFGRLDLLFNNAGLVIPATPLEDLDLAQWQASIDINLTGPFLCAQQAIKLMKNQSPPGGRIINNGSVSAHVPRPHSGAYTATKHAITGLTKSIGLDCRPYRIACGQIDIGNARDQSGGAQAENLLQPNGRREAEPVMDYTNVAKAIVYMAGLPLDANVPFLTVLATNMPYGGRG